MNIGSGDPDRKRVAQAPKAEQPDVEAQTAKQEAEQPDVEAQKATQENAERNDAQDQMANSAPPSKNKQKEQKKLTSKEMLMNLFPDLDYVHNYDYVLKAMQGYRQEFQDLCKLDPSITIGDSLSTEFVHIKEEKADLVFALEGSPDKIGLHIEHEADLSRSDMLRIRNYNTNLSCLHNRELSTVIITTKAHCKVLDKSNCVFKPLIIELNKRDGDKIYDEIDEKMKNGEDFSRLDLIYLPLSNSSKTPSEMLKAIAMLVYNSNKNSGWKHSTIFMMLLVANKVVPEADIFEIFQEMIRMDMSLLDRLNKRAINEIVSDAVSDAVSKTTEKLAKEYRKKEILRARKAVQHGLDINTVAEDYELTNEELEELKKSLKS